LQHFVAFSQIIPEQQSDVAEQTPPFGRQHVPLGQSSPTQQSDAPEQPNASGPQQCPLPQPPKEQW